MDNSVVYTISLDAVDFNFIPTSYKRSYDKVVPLWTKSNLDYENNDYYEFEVKTAREKCESEDICNKTTLCKICNIDIPTVFMKEHKNSRKHKNSVKLTDSILERVKVSTDNGNESTSEQVTSKYFCTYCCVGVDIKEQSMHQKSLAHKNSVAMDNVFNEIVNVYANNNDEIDNDETVEDTFNNIISENKKVKSRWRDCKKDDGLQQKRAKDKIEITCSSNSFVKPSNNKMETNKKLVNYVYEMDKLKMEEYFTFIEERYILPMYFKVISDKLIEIETVDGSIVIVSDENFHGIKMLSKTRFQCLMCQKFMKAKMLDKHKYDEMHAETVCLPLKDKNCIRQINNSLSHCILCNSIIESGDYHSLCNEEHNEHLRKALKADKSVNSVISNTIARKTNYKDPRNVASDNSCDGFICVNPASVSEYNIADSKISYCKMADSKMADTKMSDNRISDCKMADTKVSDNKISDCKMADTKVSDNKISDCKMAYSKIVDSKLSDNKISDCKMTDSKIVDTKMSDSKISDSAKQGENKDNKIVEKQTLIPCEDSKESYCKDCNLYISKIQLKHHLNSPKHKLNEQSELHYLMKEISPIELMCRICEVPVKNDLDEIKTHILYSDHWLIYHTLMIKNNMKVVDENTYFCERCSVIISLRNEIYHIENRHNDYIGDENQVEDNENCDNSDKEILYTVQHYYKCQVCDVKIPNDENNINMHFKGKPHLKKLDAMRTKETANFFGLVEIDKNENDLIPINHPFNYHIHMYCGVFKCLVCDIRVSEDERSNHLDGDLHTLKFELLLKEHRIIELANKSYYCKVCNVDTGVRSELVHIKGKKHNKNVLKRASEVNKPKLMFNEDASKAVLKPFKPEIKKTEEVDKKIIVASDNVIPSTSSSVAIAYLLGHSSDILEITKNPKEVKCNVCKTVIPNTEFNLRTHIFGTRHRTALSLL